jgi:hypothetical protein
VHPDAYLHRLARYSSCTTSPRAGGRTWFVAVEQRTRRDRAQVSGGRARPGDGPQADGGQVREHRGDLGRGGRQRQAGGVASGQDAFPPAAASIGVALAAQAEAQEEQRHTEDQLRPGRRAGVEQAAELRL